MTVGSSGRDAARVRVETAMGRTRLARMNAMAAGSEENITCTCPLARSVSAGGAPLYGTWVHVTPVIERNSSPDRWVMVPVPADATLMSPGLAFASATRSCTDLSGIDGCTITTIGVDAIMAIGTRSLSVS